MDHSVLHFSTVFMAFFAIMNPIVNAPVFVAITQNEDVSTLRSVAFRASLLAFVIIAMFTILGRQIFEVFGITLPAFRIAGGILVGMVGFHMLQGRENTTHTPTQEDNANSREAALSLAISPLALPVLAGPGTIATAMNFSAGASLVDLSLVLLAVAVICMFNFIAFDSSRQLVRWLGQNAIKVVSRLMGLILAVVGVQMLIDGIRGAFFV